MKDAISSLMMQKIASYKKAPGIKHLGLKMKDEKDAIASSPSSLVFPFKIKDLQKDETYCRPIEISRAASSFQPPP